MFTLIAHLAFDNGMETANDFAGALETECSFTVISFSNSIRFLPVEFPLDFALPFLVLFSSATL
jgi:hypothetical protein